MAGESRYCALYTRTQAQHRVAQTLHRFQKDGDGIVFYPCVEIWSRSCRSRVIRPMMPGYVFIRSRMSAAQIHSLVKLDRRLLGTYIRELGLDMGDGSGVNSEEEEPKIETLSEEESAFLDSFLEACWVDDGHYSPEGKSGTSICRAGVPVQNEKCEKSMSVSWIKDGQETGTDINSVLDESNNRCKVAEPQQTKDSQPQTVFRMSYGYKEDDRYVVMEGPLVGQESHILRVNIHDRKATLDYAIGGRKIHVGLETKPKRYWFPDDETAPVVIAGDYEVDLEKVKQSMMTIRA